MIKRIYIIILITLIVLIGVISWWYTIQLNQMNHSIQKFEDSIGKKENQVDSLND